MINKLMSFTSGNKLTRGFTFIEMIVVIAVLALALPAVFAIVFGIMNQQARVIRLTQLKQEGDFSMQVMENLIRNNAQEVWNGVDPVTTTTIKCDDPVDDSSYSNHTGEFRFVDKNDSSAWFRFSLISDKIASYSSVLNGTRELTSSKVKISEVGTTPFISCKRESAYSAPIISINFAIEHLDSGLRPDEVVPTMVYSSNVVLRSY